MSRCWSRSWIAPSMYHSQARTAARCLGGGSPPTLSPSRIRVEVRSRTASISARTAGTLPAVSHQLAVGDHVSPIQPRKASTLRDSASSGGSAGSGSVSRLTSSGHGWLWVASALLVVHWLGDSLDGTLARVRQIQRPRYGYYLDHLVDAVSTALIGLGLGLSPYMLLSVGTLLVVAYLVLSINVYLESQALGRFSIGYGLFGPTEARLLLIALNTALALGLELRFDLLGNDLTALDLAGLGLAAVMVLLLLRRMGRNMRELDVAEPAATRGRRLA